MRISKSNSRISEILCFAIIFTFIFGVIPIESRAIVSATVSGEIITLEPIDVSGRDITIAGTISSGENREVTVTVIDPDGEVNYFEQQTTGDPEGNYSFQYRLGDHVPSGTFTVMVGGSSINTLVSETFMFFSDAARAEAVTEFNAADDLQKMENAIQNNIIVLNLNLSKYNALTNKTPVLEMLIAGSYVDAADLKKELNKAVATQEINEAVSKQKMIELLNNNNTVLGLDMVSGSSYNGLTGIAKDIVHQVLWDKREYVSAQVLKALFQEMVALTAVNTAEWAEMEQVLLKNKEVLKLNLSGDYEKLKASSKVVLYKALAEQNFDKIEDIKEAFDNKVEELIFQESKASNGNRSGGSGGSVSKKVVISDPVVQTPGNNTIFNDLSDVLWAKESIEFLASKGILAGVGNYQFKPNDKVTREQFIKMLIMGFGLLDNTATATFHDVQADAWYYSYIASAEKSGITQGMGNGNFGVGIEISRQEMTVLAYRAAKHAKIQIVQNGDAVIFADVNTIADYARDSIEAMQRAGIINGIGNNYFAPMENTTRAQAAKIIYGLLKFGE